MGCGTLLAALKSVYSYLIACDIITLLGNKIKEIIKLKYKYFFHSYMMQVNWFHTFENMEINVCV